jgi:ribosomal protein S3AE
MIENTEVVTQNGQSIEIGNACHTRQRIKTKQKQAKNEHNVRKLIYQKIGMHNRSGLIKTGKQRHSHQ